MGAIVLSALLCIVFTTVIWVNKYKGDAAYYIGWFMLFGSAVSFVVAIVSYIFTAMALPVEASCITG